jgi:hypothetical protein
MFAIGRCSRSRTPVGEIELLDRQDVDPERRRTGSRAAFPASGRSFGIFFRFSRGISQAEGIPT